MIRTACFLGILILMMGWEAVMPKRKLRFGKMRWPANFGLVLIDSVLVQLLIPTGAAGIAIWAELHGWGLLHLLDVPRLWAVLVSVLMLDMLIYGQHVVFHRLPWLWRLHKLHHADPDIDVSTALRFHPLEILLSMLIKMAAILALGVPPVAVLIFEIILNGMAIFNHSNIQLPAVFDRMLRILWVTPDMHRIHHSVYEQETNSNYGFNLSCWDRLFSTYICKPQDGQHKMIIGLPQYQERHDLIWMLLLPFKNS